jgi:hypothetical protein
MQAARRKKAILKIAQQPIGSVQPCILTRHPWTNLLGPQDQVVHVQARECADVGYYGPSVALAPQRCDGYVLLVSDQIRATSQHGKLIMKTSTAMMGPPQPEAIVVTVAITARASTTQIGRRL